MAQLFTSVITFFLIFNIVKASDDSKDTAHIFIGGALGSTTNICGYRVPTVLLEGSFHCLEQKKLDSLSAAAVHAILQISMLKQFTTEHALGLSLKGCSVASFVRTRAPGKNVGHPNISAQDRIEAEYLDCFNPIYLKLIGKKHLSCNDFVKGLLECHAVLGLQDLKLIAAIKEIKKT